MNNYSDKNYKYKFCIEDNAGFILGLSHYYCKKNYINYALIANLEGIFSYIISEWNSPKLHFKFIPKLREEEKKHMDLMKLILLKKTLNVF